MKRIKWFVMVWIAIAWLSIGFAFAHPTDTTNPSVMVAAATVDVPAASTIVSTETPAMEVISTDEIKLPVDAPNPDELPGLVNNLIELIKNKSWPAAIALAIVILMGVLKLDFVGNLLIKYVPKRIMPLIPIGLGVIAGAIQGWISGGWQQATQVVVESGVLAIVFHQIWSHTVKGKDSEKQE